MAVGQVAELVPSPLASRGCVPYVVGWQGDTDQLQCRIFSVAFYKSLAAHPGAYGKAFSEASSMLMTINHLDVG